MATYLGIYSKSGEIKKERFKKVLLDFSLNGSRRLISKENERMLFFYVDSFKENYCDNETTFSFYSGNISFTKTTEFDNQERSSTKLLKYINKNKTTHLDLLEGAFSAIHYNTKTQTLILFKRYS